MQFVPFLRLVPLAAAAAASVATSMATLDLTIKSTSPPPGESAVRPDAVLTVRVHVDSQPDGTSPPGEIVVRTVPEGVDVAGTSTRSSENGDLVYRFEPRDPLPAGAYEIWFASGAVGYMYFEDPLLEEVRTRNLSGGEILTHFSTESQPQVRYAVYSLNTFTISFSEDMDPATLDQVKILDTSGAELSVTRTWKGGDLHLLEIQAPGGAVDILLDQGLRGSTGEPVAGTPFVVENVRR